MPKRLSSYHCKALTNQVKYRKTRPILQRNMNDTLQELYPKETSWYLSYILSTQLSNKKFNNKFHLRFRISHSSFIWIHGKVMTHPLFKR